MNFGRAYKRVLDVVRSSPPLTFLVFGIRINKRIIPFTWDVTTLVLKKAIDRAIPDCGKSVLDMGCGHVGLLAQYVKRTKPSSSVTAADIYPEFVENAESNARANGLSVSFTQSDLYESVAGKFDFILFNPPYVPLTDVQKDYPRSVYGGVEGTDTIQRFLAESRDHLASDGRILLGVNCFHVSEERMKTIIQSHCYTLEAVEKRRFNTARVFVLRPPSE